MAVSSRGQDTWFSATGPGFDSPYRYQIQPLPEPLKGHAAVTPKRVWRSKAHSALVPAGQAAGITGRRTPFVYVPIAEHWERVQHAASIRAALKIIRGTRWPGNAIPLPFREDRRCVVSTRDETGWCQDDG